MGEVYSHLSEEERQVIQIEVGNGASIRGIGAMLGRSPSSISREIKRNTWFPSNENESYRPYRPKRLKAGPWTGRYYICLLYTSMPCASSTLIRCCTDTGTVIPFLSRENRTV